MNKKFFLLIPILIASYFPINQNVYKEKNEVDKTLNNQLKSGIPFNVPYQGIEKEYRSDKINFKHWFSEIRNNILQSEYYIRWQKAYGCYSSPNRLQNLRFFYYEDGYAVSPRAIRILTEKNKLYKGEKEIQYKDEEDWQIKFFIDKKWRSGGKWSIEGNKAEYIMPHMTIQYLNNMEGMRQNFILNQKISGKIEIKVSLKTLQKYKVFSDKIVFFHHKTNRPILEYRDLKVWDAEHKLLKGYFKKIHRGFKIVVEAADAVFPVTIDPLNTTPSAIIEGNQNDAGLGVSVSSAGDVNGDGYSDIIVGAYQYDNGNTDEGAAFIFQGSSSGINTSPAAQLEVNQDNAWFGASVSLAGDINGDGYGDVIVGAPQYDNGNTDEGAAFLFHGSATGINTSYSTLLDGNQDGANLGPVSTAGDVNGDGYSDVIVGVPYFDNGNLNEGQVRVYHGSSSGLNSTPTTILESNQDGAEMGWDVSAAGDVNGDGFSDIIIGIPKFDNGQNNEGICQIYHGSNTGLNSTPATTLEMNQSDADFGFSVSTAGDVNGDGYSDIVVGAPLYDNGQTDEGTAFVYHGSFSGTNATPSSTLDMNQTDSRFGHAVSVAGDLNADGYSDIIVGAEYYENPEPNEGAFFIYTGSSGGITNNPAVSVESNASNTFLGFAVASAGDVNGDGMSDVVVGGDGFTNGQTDEGAAFVYHGTTSGINTLEADTLESNQSESYFGISVNTAGDVNGDGYDDVIAGAWLYDNGETDEGAAFIYHGSISGINTSPALMIESNQAGAGFGSSVSSAGDVNGDGYSDIIVGAFLYSNPENQEGRVYVYHGSASGVNSTPAATMESNQNGAWFGFVSSAGDINGDGYSDVIAGAPLYDFDLTDEGGAFLYYGSSTGINTNPAVSLEGNQTDSYFGLSISAAGDVNGDGYGDIIIGAPLHDNGQTDEGRIYIYHGSSTGISSTPSATRESDINSAGFGRSVSSAGDVNGDGFSDVIIGAPGYSNNETEEGAAYLFHGSSSGISTSADLILESNQNNANFGICVSSAGDVNGDGYNDIIIGAEYYDNGQNNEGRAFIYHGSPSGINSGNFYFIESNQNGALFGVSVSSAGDVNADGFSDILVGADYYDKPLTDEGIVVVNHGNLKGDNVIRNNIRIYDDNLTTLYGSSNFSDNHFGIGLYVKSFLGRDSGKLVWEVRKNFDAYSGNPITNSVSYSGQQTTFTNLGLVGTELKNVVTKANGALYTKMRARVRYHLAKAITGQVYGPWRTWSLRKSNHFHLGVIKTGILLPVDLVSFRVSWLQKGQSAQISFHTVNENRVEAYEIERSRDGIHFTKVVKIPARNIGVQQSYQYADYEAQSRKVYYRLKILELSGSYQYSNIVKLTHQGIEDILVYPNPARENIQIGLTKEFRSLEVDVWDIGGRLVKQITLNRPGRQVMLPTGDLPAGIYWLHLRTENNRQTVKLVKE
ncbi:MAG: FG-GAP-like repeat-containing protein [Chitinophagaceae bacterium]|nr:FG-GAP-like repeat-containing protein [Chitinophagaceae bacterium]